MRLWYFGLQIILGIGFMLGSSPAFSAGEPSHEKIQELAASKKWMRLLHYRRGLPFYRLRSDLDGPGFFIAPDGKTNPVAELKANVEAFSRSDLQIGKLKQHAQCAFPERYRFLKAELKLNIQDVECAKLDEFMQRFHNPKSVTLVFSNAYPDNPASMFGHTFLRFNAGTPRAGSEKKLDLLDQGVSFAANVGPDENPLVFYYLGLTGGYPGAFTLVPYYVKVNEYNHAEARDLWEYELTLSEQETVSLLRHIWEIETNSWLDYYFFDENCSSLLLATLETVRPDWDLAPSNFWVIPGETIKVVARAPGVVKDVKFRPSFRRKLLDRYTALSAPQKKEFFRLRSGELSPSTVTDLRTIDTLTAYYFYVKQKAEGKLPEPQQKLMTEALIRRSELGAQSREPDAVPTAPVWNTRPDQGHDGTRFGLSGGWAGVSSTSSTSGKSLFFQELNWRSAFHDLMNDDVGYLRFSQIEFPNLTLRYYPSRANFRVERIGILSIMSLFPISALEKKASWGFDLTYDSPKDFGCIDCHTMRGRGGIGLASDFISDDVMLYGLAVANIEAGESLRKGYRVGPGVQLSAIANPLNSYKARVAYQLISDLFQEDRHSFFYQLDVEQSLSLSPFWELRATGSLYRGYDEAKLSIQYYF